MLYLNVYLILNTTWYHLLKLRREESPKPRRWTDLFRVSKDRTFILRNNFSRSKMKEGGSSTRKTDCGFHAEKFPE